MIGRAAERVGVEMRIALRRARARVTEQLADDRQPEAGAGTEARMRVPQIVNAQPSESGPLSDRAPGPVEVGARLLAVRPGAWPAMT